ncbi:MAG: nitrilase-related carbon-nitrogen hydrolase, partial [Pseudomonadota bacterium]
MPRIAVLQMTSGIDPEANFSAIEDAIRDAATQRAAILFTPEMAVLLDRKRSRATPWIAGSGPGKLIKRCGELAQSLGVDLCIGSMPVPGDQDKFANRSFYFPASGAPSVTYDKMHMFDVELSTGESWRESSAYSAGNEVVTIEETPLGRLGLTICYDMRFPALFEALGQRACDVIAVPAAFTKPTGAA